mmetsp:Transcript_29719/g.32349  ORF Transcript_29719/g.32349 Transcript_29719/m.32349 type:complete len:131 (+) Transcript_29719:40-432(+)
MLKTVQTILTTYDDAHHSYQGSHKRNIRSAHFVNPYTRREIIRRNRQERKKENENQDQSPGWSRTTSLLYHFMYIPRILKNDLRRQYPIIFANVYNTCDSNLMLKFFHQFCDVHTGIVNIADTYPPSYQW